MKIDILNRWSAKVIFTAEIPDDTPAQFRVRAAVELAVSQRASLSGSNLRGSDLSGSNLRGSNLRGSDLRDSNLRGSNLSGCDLSGSDLRGCDLSAAKNLTAEQLVQIRDDLWAVLSAAPREVDGLRKALAEGRVDGSTYSGECACLVGTIANVRGCSEFDLGILKPNASRPIECWFMGINKGDTPDTNVCAKWALAWCDEWLTNMRAAFGAKP